MIYSIFEELKSTNSTKIKEQILQKYKNNDLLKEVLYQALSPRVKFYIKKIPEYTRNNSTLNNLNDAIQDLKILSSRVKTGNDAIQFLQNLLSNLSQNDATILERIISKDLKIGLNKATVNKVWKNLIETTPYMGAKAFDKNKARNLFLNNKIISQVKMDGRYANALINEDIILESRGGEITYINNALDDVLSLVKPGYVLNGELTIPGYSRYESNGIIASIISINKKINDGETADKELNNFFKEHHMTLQDMSKKIVYTVWDMITMEEYLNLKSNRTYKERFVALQEMIKEINSDRLQLVEYRYVDTYEKAIEHFKEMLQRGEEGTIIKTMDCKWVNGKPNEQMKLKIEFSTDLRIIGFNEGAKGTRLENNLGSLICESECGLLKTSPGGITDKMRKYIWDNREALLGTYVEVKCSGISVTDNGYSMLHPRFEKLRDDKHKGNDLNEILLIEKGIKDL